MATTNYQRNNPYEDENAKAAKAARDSLSPYSSDAVSLAAQKARDENLLAEPTYGGSSYDEYQKNILNQIENRGKFSYDLNGDALYNQYKNQYMQQGKLAMADTIGRASAMTGGYGNSYAATAGNQAYQGYLTKLNDVVPELYQMAYDKYNNETSELYDKASLYKSLANQDYEKYRDTYSDWYNKQNMLNDLAYRAEANSRSNYEYDATRADNAYNDALKFAISEADTNYKNGLPSSTTSSGISDDQILQLESYRSMNDNEGLARYLDALIIAGNLDEETAKQLYDAYAVDEDTGADTETPEKKETTGKTNEGGVGTKAKTTSTTPIVPYDTIDNTSLLTSKSLPATTATPSVTTLYDAAVQLEKNRQEKLKKQNPFYNSIVPTLKK